MASKIEEGMEWTDGQFNYIAYRKADGRMVIRDVEGFDWEDVEGFLSLDDGMPLTEVTLTLRVPSRSSAGKGKPRCFRDDHR